MIIRLLRDLILHIKNFGAMKKIKEFIKKKQLDSRFKQAGGGYQLGANSSSSVGTEPPFEVPIEDNGSRDGRAQMTPERVHESELRAKAIERRLQQPGTGGLTQTQKMVRMKAKKELDEEKRMAQQISQIEMDDHRQQNNRSAAERVPSVLFTCEVFDDDVALPKSEILTAIEDALREHMQADPVEASTMLIHTFNKEDQKSAAIGTISKYLQNIVEQPDEKKFQKIRTSNKVYAEKVAPLKGALEFLNAVGFRAQIEAGEEFLVMASPPNIEAIAAAAKTLQEGKPIPIRVYRDPKVFFVDPQQPIPSPDIPDDFFNRTAEEIRQEQKARTEAVEKMTTLRTQQMRERDGAPRNAYKYCFIRIRFPNNFVLQGIFNVHEKFSTVREFVAPHLACEHGTFALCPSGSEAKHLDPTEHSLSDYSLVPSALVHFRWEQEQLNDFARQLCQPSYLKAEFEARAEKIN